MNKEASLSKFNFINSYEDTKRAEAYARLEFAGTYQLAYRDLPDIIFNNVQGKKAIDFGCGTGRSTRFLQKLGFNVIGIDIAGDMVKKAKEIDPKGDYRRIDDGNFNQFKKNYYDLVLSVFTFDNIPIRDKKVRILSKIRDLLNENGRIINIVSAPEIYTNEWVSFSTKDFPENKHAKSGDKVKIIITDIEDKRPVEDILCSDDDYKKVFNIVGIELVETYRPLAKGYDSYNWVNETRIAPWTIYVLKKKYFDKKETFN